MPTLFPGSLDSFSTKVDGSSDVLAADTNNLQDAVTALQTKVGVNGSSNTSSVDYKLADVLAKANTALNPLPATAAAAIGAVGTYAMLRYAGDAAAGAMVAGSSLAYASVNSSGVSFSGTPDGTWMLCGYTTNSRASVWKRVS